MRRALSLIIVFLLVGILATDAFGTPNAYQHGPGYYKSTAQIARMNGNAVRPADSTNVTRVDMTANIVIPVGNISSATDVATTINGDDIAKAIQARLNNNATLCNVTVSVNVTINTIHAGRDYNPDIQGVSNLNIGNTDVGRDIHAGTISASVINAGKTNAGGTT